MAADTLTAQAVLAEGLDDWRYLFGALHTRFRTGDFARALRLVDAVGAAAEEADHHPDLTLSYGRVDVRLSSHDVGGVTARDVRLARRISELAAEAGVTAAPEGVAVVEIGLDTPDVDAVRPFWKALLGYADGSDGETELRDPAGMTATLWFQRSEADEPRQRFHLDVNVPHDVAPARIEAALAAGGTLVSDARAPAFVVLADAEGNQACVCTTLGRD